MRTIALDFDGVIHSYSSGWTGPIPTDPPVPGAAEAIAAIRGLGFRVSVFTCRALTQDGRAGIFQWLAEHGITVDEVTAIKPHAVLYVDDRGMRFTGSWIEVVEVARIRAFAPWNAGGAAGQITPAAWESKPPRCATCGGAVDGVTVYGRYTACGHPIPEGGKVS